MSFTVTNNNAVTLSYHAFIDCPLFQIQPMETAILILSKHFTDSSATNYTLSVNNQGSVHALNADTRSGGLIIKPESGCLLQNRFFLYFYYQNTGTTKLNFNFTFTPDATNYCQRIITGQPEYNIG